MLKKSKIDPWKEKKRKKKKRKSRQKGSQDLIYSVLKRFSFFFWEKGEGERERERNGFSYFRCIRFVPDL